MENRLLEKLARDEVALGVGLNYPNPNCIQVMGRGWDWLWVDAQHGQHDYSDLIRTAQVAELAGIPCVIRGASQDPATICRMLDTHAAGLVVPMVNTPEEAQRIVEAAYYPPHGTRSYGGRRMGDVEGRDYYKTAHKHTLLAAQIETPEAVARAEAIAAIEGIDALHIGPDDLKIRMGIPIDTPLCKSDPLLEAIGQVAQAARKAGKASGCNVGDVPSVRKVVSLGVRMIMGGSDLRFLKVGSAAQLKALRETAREPG